MQVLYELVAVRKECCCTFAMADVTSLAKPGRRSRALIFKSEDLPIVVLFGHE